ncbi:MAG: glycosyltransferase family 1 protein [Acidobacteriota bacterium]
MRDGSSPVPLSVTILADLLEEKWPSMDLVADMLTANLSSLRPPLDARLIRPPMTRRFSSAAASSGSRFMLDRALNRFHDYPRLLKGARSSDVYHVVDHSYAHLVHSLPADRTIVTCHDLDAFRSLFDSGFGPRPLWFRTMMRRVLGGMLKAGRVVFDTETVRREFLSNVRLDETRTAVIPLGVHPACSPEPDGARDEAARAMFSSGGSASLNILHVGSTMARKRIEHLLAIVARLSVLFPDVRLVRVGGAFSPGQKALAKELGIAERINVAPFIKPSRLAALYRSADVLLLPSSAEGFGLPMLEAMACGTPAIVSDLPVLREVGGEAAIYAGDDSVEGWVETVDDLLEQLRSGSGSAFRDRGLTHAQAFTWERVAESYSEVYGSLISSSAER